MNELSRNPKLILGLVIGLMLTVIMQTYMLHDCSERLKSQRVNIRQELFQELDSMAWEYEVHPNTKYVTGVKRYYKCDVIKLHIQKEIK